MSPTDTDVSSTQLPELTFTLALAPEDNVGAIDEVVLDDASVEAADAVACTCAIVWTFLVTGSNLAIDIFFFSAAANAFQRISAEFPPNSP